MRYIVLDMKVNVGRNNINTPIEFRHDRPYDSIEIHVRNKEIINSDIVLNCTVRVSYGTLERQLGFRKRDLYYLNTPLRSITNDDIKQKLLDSGLVRDIILSKK